MGVATEGIATARAYKESEVAGSFAGMGTVLNSYGAARAAFPLRMSRAATISNLLHGTVSHVSNSSERGAP
jgi:hypothetical protein